MIVADTWGMLLSEAMAKESLGDSVGGAALVERALELILLKRCGNPNTDQPPFPLLVSAMRSDFADQEVTARHDCSARIREGSRIGKKPTRSFLLGTRQMPVEADDVLGFAHFFCKTKQLMRA